MPQYLLSVHSVEGEARDTMTEEEPLWSPAGATGRNRAHATW